MYQYYVPMLYSCTNYTYMYVHDATSRKMSKLDFKPGNSTFKTFQPARQRDNLCSSSISKIQISVSMCSGNTHCCILELLDHPLVQSKLNGPI